MIYNRISIRIVIDRTTINTLIIGSRIRIIIIQRICIIHILRLMISLSLIMSLR